MPDLFYNSLTSASPASHLWFLFGGIILVGLLVALLWLAEDEPAVKPKEAPDPRIALALNDIAEAVWELARIATPPVIEPEPVKPLFDKYPTPEQIAERQERNQKHSTRSKPRSKAGRK